MTPEHIASAFERLRSHNPSPTTELNFQSTFELLISVILSAQATDISVNKATAKLYAVANTPAAILNLGLEGLTGFIRTIGLYNTKAKNILGTCEILLQQHNDQVPNTRQELEILPGVGRKTANVILNTAFGQPTIAVDTHIFRVSNRTGIAPGNTVLTVEKQLLHQVPEQYKKNAHHWLILHGRYTCTARKPDCESCILNDLCDSAFQYA